MRKKLLITATAMLGIFGTIFALFPSCVLARTVATNGVNSGFFAQFDAKIMNAKLEIKNEKKTTVGADESTDKDTVAENLRKEIIAQLTGLQWEVFSFTAGSGHDRENFMISVLEQLDLSIVEKNDDQIGIAILKALNSFARSKYTKTRDDDREKIHTALGKSMALGEKLNTLMSSHPDDTKGLTKDEKKDIANLALDAVFDNSAESNLAFDAFVKNIKEFGQKIIALVPTVDLKTPLKMGTILGALANHNSGIVVVSQRGNDPIAETLMKRELRASQILNAITSVTLKKGIFFSFAKSPVVDAKEVNRASSIFSSAAYATDLKTVSEAPSVIGSKFRHLVEDRIKRNKKILAERNLADMTDRKVYHQALAGGIGATTGYLHNFGSCAASLSGSADYHWGTLSFIEDKSGVAPTVREKNKLGFGLQADLGIHGIVNQVTTLGVLLGIRAQRLHVGNINAITLSTNSENSYTSHWMINPVVSVQARLFFTDSMYGAWTIGYMIPLSEKKFDTKNTSNPKAKMRFQGLTGGFSLGIAY